MKRCLLALLSACIIGDFYLAHNIKRIKEIREQTRQTKKKSNFSSD